MTQVIYVDASYRQQDGNGHISWVNDTTGKHHYDPNVNCANSHICELYAVLRALEAHKEVLETDQLNILMDNEAVAGQLNSKMGINGKEARSLVLKIWSLTEGRKVSFLKIPRKQNKAGKLLGS